MRERTYKAICYLSVLLISGCGVAQTKPDKQQSVETEILRNQVVYTIHGRKDPRLSATFEASYVSTSKSEACSYEHRATATRKVRIGTKRYPITEENYRIEIPVYLEENENECGYRFSRIELVLRRLYDRDLYARHIVLDYKPLARAIYRGSRSGFGGQATLEMPAELVTSKRHFRIAEETQYVCSTKYYKRREYARLYCLMKIRDGLGRNGFIATNKYNTVVTHPEFGVDEIKNEILKVNIIADDERSKLVTGKEILPDYFRELPKFQKNRTWFLGD